MRGQWGVNEGSIGSVEVGLVRVNGGSTGSVGVMVQRSADRGRDWVSWYGILSYQCQGRPLAMVYV